jgi:cysteinyl-tRNA synthetase
LLVKIFFAVLLLLMMFGFRRRNEDMSRMIRQKLVEWECDYESAFSEAIKHYYELKIREAALSEKEKCFEEKQKLMEKTNKGSKVKVYNMIENQRANSNNDQSTNVTSNVINSPGAIATVGKYISEVTATVSQQLESSSASDQVKYLMKQLSEQIAAIDPSVNPAKIEQMGKDLKALSEEMAGAEPRRKWYELSLEGIKEAAIAIGDVAKPVVDIVTKLIPLLIS